MSHFIKLTVNDSLYDSLVSLSEIYSIPVATLCNFLVATGANDLGSSCISKSGLINFIKSHSVDGFLSADSMLGYIGNHSSYQKISKNIRKYKIKRCKELYGKRNSNKKD